MDLTKRQQEIFDFIKRYSAKYGYPPTVRDIGKAVGLASSSTARNSNAGVWAFVGERHTPRRTCMGANATSRPSRLAVTTRNRPAPNASHQENDHHHRSPHTQARSQEARPEPRVRQTDDAQPGADGGHRPRPRATDRGQSTRTPMRIPMRARSPRSRSRPVTESVALPSPRTRRCRTRARRRSSRAPR